VSMPHAFPNGEGLKRDHCSVCDAPKISMRLLISCCLAARPNDLEDAITSFEPAVGTNTLILPLLNGMDT
jgi:hypothetical protein